MARREVGLGSTGRRVISSGNLEDRRFAGLSQEPRAALLSRERTWGTSSSSPRGPMERGHEDRVGGNLREPDVIENRDQP